MRAACEAAKPPGALDHCSSLPADRGVLSHPPSSPHDRSDSGSFHHPLPIFETGLFLVSPSPMGLWVVTMALLTLGNGPHSSPRDPFQGRLPTSLLQYCLDVFFSWRSVGLHFTLPYTQDPSPPTRAKEEKKGLGVGGQSARLSSEGSEQTGRSHPS